MGKSEEFWQNVVHWRRKRKFKKVKWLSEEALQIAEERWQEKGKGERERYIQLYAEF